MSLPLLAHPIPSKKSSPLSFQPVSPHISNLHSNRFLRLRSLSFQIPQKPRLSLNFVKLGFSHQRILLACLGNSEGETKSVVDEEQEARGQSTMPERFRHLTKEAPDKPVRWQWPFFIVLCFLVYAWRTVAWELTNWKNVGISIIKSVGFFLKLVVAIIFHFIGDPVTSVIRCIENLFYDVRSFYSSIVAYTPVDHLTLIIVLTSAVLAISEATAPGSINSQPYLLTLAGLLGYLAVVGSIPAFLFWLLLLGILCFSRFVKKRDMVSAALPVAAVVTAVGAPWVRGMVMALYTGVAIFQHSKSPKEEGEVGLAAAGGLKLPLPLLWVGLAIGVHIAAKWVRYRHLTWMIV